MATAEASSTQPESVPPARLLDADSVVAHIAANPSLTRLDGCGIPLGGEGLARLARAISETRPPLCVLSLSNCQGVNVGTAAIAEAIGSSQMHQLHTLDLMGNGIGKRGALAIVAALPSLPKLTHLGLGWNENIKGAPAHALAQFAIEARLDSFCGLPLAALRRGQLPPMPPPRPGLRRPFFGPDEELHLQGHGCGPAGAIVVAGIIPQLRGLRAISMHYQCLGDEGALIVAKAAANYPSRMEFVMLSRNDISQAAQPKIAAMFPHLDTDHLRMNDGGTC